MRYHRRWTQAIVLCLALWTTGCRSYQAVAPLEARPESEVQVTFRDVRDWMVPGKPGEDARAVRSRLLLARLVRVAGDTVVLAPVRLADQRGRVFAFPADAARLSLTPADGAQISTSRFSRGRTGLLVVGLAIVAWVGIMASSCIMCGFGEGGSYPY